MTTELTPPQQTAYILEIRLAATDVLDKPLRVPFKSTHDTLTLASTVIESIRGIKADRSRQGQEARGQDGAGAATGMSEPIDNGGPAFPVTGKQLPLLGNELVAQFVHFPHGGMTLRAWLAGRALSGLLANSSIEILLPGEYASDCLLYADAIIAALKAQP